MPQHSTPPEATALPAWSHQLQQLAQALPYPPTPNLARVIPPSRTLWPPMPLRWVTLGLALLLVALVVSPVSAGLWEWVQIGVVRIWQVTNTAVPPTSTATATPHPKITASPTLTLNTTPTLWPPLATPLPKFSDWGGYTTLAQAQAQMAFTILQPSYPNNLGAPDYVFAQNYPGDMVVLIWLDPEAPDNVQLSLHILTGAFWIEKALGEDDTLVYTEVAGTKAVWTDGTYPMRLKSGTYENTRLVSGHVLIWANANFTYRLETTLPLTEAVRIAESLR